MTTGGAGAEGGDERDLSPTDSRPRKRPTLGIACGVVLACVLAAIVFVRVVDPFHSPTYCKGIGLGGGSVRDSPEQAFVEWLGTGTDKPPRKDWRHEGDTYVNKLADDSALRAQAQFYWYRSVQVSGEGYRMPDGQILGPDQWTVSGACV